MSKICFPIIVVEGSNVDFYRSTIELERELEGIDVSSAGYRAFDATGKVMTMVVEGVTDGVCSAVTGTVRITGIEAQATHEEELKQILHRYLESIRRPAPRPLTLSRLVAACLDT